MKKVNYLEIAEPFRKAGEWICLDWNFAGDEIRINRFDEKPIRNDMLNLWSIKGSFRNPYIEFNKIEISIPKGMEWNTSLLEPIEVSK